VCACAYVWHTRERESVEYSAVLYDSMYKGVQLTGDI